MADTAWRTQRIAQIKAALAAYQPGVTSARDSSGRSVNIDQAALLAELDKLTAQDKAAKSGGRMIKLSLPRFREG